uniref:acidic phospholipase A2 CM-II-like n=1 Tax=Styela clava TaxID=7725 RepID=UPI00193A8A96|nr:acidic phospholipase A2 CM-II-like [Styela clava]
MYFRYYGFYLLIIISSVMMKAKTQNQHTIVKRNAWQLGKMIQCAQNITRWHSFWAMSYYADYGCFCGQGGSGSPVDESDRCCYIHDQCYGEVESKSQLSGSRFYWATYQYECTQGCISCYGNGWRQELCKCDKDLAQCLATHRVSYLSSNINLNISKHC